MSGVSLPRSASLISGYSCRALSQQFGTYDVVTLTYGCFYFPSSLSLPLPLPPPFALIFYFFLPFVFYISRPVSVLWAGADFLPLLVPPTGVSFTDVLGRSDLVGVVSAPLILGRHFYQIFSI